MGHSTSNRTQTLWIPGTERSGRFNGERERSRSARKRSRRRRCRRSIADHCEGTTARWSTGIGRDEDALERLHWRQFGRGFEPCAGQATTPTGDDAGDRSNPSHPPAWHQPGTNNLSKHKPMGGSGPVRWQQRGGATDPATEQSLEAARNRTQDIGPGNRDGRKHRQSNSEGARTAVTRGCCWRGKTSEGYKRQRGRQQGRNHIEAFQEGSRARSRLPRPHSAREWLSTLGSQSWHRSPDRPACTDGCR